MQFEIESQDGEVTCVRLKGHVRREGDGGPAEPLGELLGEGAYARQVLLNMAGVEFLNSSGVSWLLVAHKRFRQGGGRVVLHSIPPLVGNVLKLLRLETVLEIAPDQRQAQARLAESAS